MAFRLFVFIAGGLFCLSFLAFFHTEGFSRETVVVFICAMLIVLLAVGIFIYTNRRLFNELTVEPSRRNFEIFVQTLTRRKEKD